jgi:hypothetical protein
MNSNHRANSAVTRARQAAASLKPVARNTSAAAKQGARTTRAWAAPQLERTGHLVEDRIAPKISSVLSSAAQRIEPGKPRHRRWPQVAGASMVTAVASALAGAVLSRRRRQNGTAPGANADSYHDAATRSGEGGPEPAAGGDEESRSNAS